MMTIPIAEIPVFDWDGRTLQTFYAISFVLAVIWSFARSRSSVNRYDRAGHSAELTDPYDAAYLSGGAPRVAQLAVVRLMQLGYVEWKSRIFNGGRLIPREFHTGTGLNAVERRMWQAIQRNGKKGLSVRDSYAAILPETRAIEVKLAAAGLRPTAEERRSACWSAALPLIALLAIGFIKVCIGISRDKPFLFLLIFMFFTLLLAIGAAASTRRLTRSGADLLAQMRLNHQRPAAAGDVCWGLAVMGPAVLAGMPEFSGIHRDFERHASSGSSGDSGGGCGTSSGCGSSGCGGGGCGGCGGGGD
jgi:uncharacterized protein (TIGR04222 family)